MRSAMLILPALAIGTVVAAQDTTTSPSAPAPAKAKTQPKIKCETIEETGSRLGSHKVCYDASRYSQDQDQVRRDFGRAQQNLSGRPGG